MIKDINKKITHKQKQKYRTTTKHILPTYSGLAPGERIVMDLKHMPKSLKGEEYMLNITDESSRLTTTIHLRKKSDAKNQYIDYCKYIKNISGRYPRYIHTDGGGEFIDTELKTFNKEKGIQHTFTSPNSSVQNPVGERINRTIGEGSLALLTTANLPSKFWSQAATTFAYIKNRTPHKFLSFSNPLTEWNIHNAAHSNINLHDIRIFGSEAYVLDEKSNKNQPKAFRCIYLGPSTSHKGSVFYNLHTKRLLVSRNFVINEQVYPGQEYWPHIYDKNFGSPPESASTGDASDTTTLPPTTVNADSVGASLPPQHNNSQQQSSQSPVASNPTLPPSPPPAANSEPSVCLPEGSDASSAGASGAAPSVCLPEGSDVSSATHHSGEEQDSQVPDDIFILPNDSPAQSEPADPAVVDIDQNTTPFNRSTTSQEGPGDLPPLDLPDDGNLDTINGQPAYEIDSVVGKRKSGFTLTGEVRKGGWKPSYGYDYRVKWTDGSETWEPEEQVDAPDAISRYENNPEEAPSQNAQEEPSPSATTPTEASTLTNFCNFVHLSFFCFLAKVQPSCQQPTWKSIVVPETRAEMLLSPEREKWLEAEKREMEQMILNKTWTRIKGKPPKKPITCRWVYKLKPPTSVQPEPIFKARLVAHGYKQKANFDYGDTFAQVATLKAFRIFLWFSAVFGMRATQCDFTSAFLQGKIDKELYMTGPPGHSSTGEVVRLNKSIYGIKQAPRIFYQTLVNFLHTLGFRELVSDSCVFKHHSKKFYVLVWVDDIVLLGKDESLREHIHDRLKEKFSLKVLGDLKHFVGFQIDRDPDGSIHLHQTNYATKILDTFSKFIPNNYKHSTPADSNVKFSTKQQPTNDREKHRMKQYPYRQLIGSLLYLLGTRPELYFVTYLGLYVTQVGRTG